MILYKYIQHIIKFKFLLTYRIKNEIKTKYNIILNIIRLIKMSQQFGFEKIEVLKETDKEAYQLLQKLSRNVQPLMKKYKWSIPLLKESDFPNHGILGMNVNKGQTILIRLRQSGSKSNFFPYEHLLGTLCHELAHNVHGPHDDKFYKFLDELQDYLENLPSNGLSGFDTTGNKIGSDSILRSKIIKNNNYNLTTAGSAGLAAEYRSKQQQLFTPAGGVKLGGVSKSKYLDKTPMQMAADAAIKREKDNLWCSNQNNQDINITIDEENKS